MLLRARGQNWTNGCCPGESNLRTWGTGSTKWTVFNQETILPKRRFLPWTRIPSSTRTCHIPTAWLLHWRPSFCFISQSTRSLPEQHCLGEEFINLNQFACNLQTRDTLNTRGIPAQVPVGFEVILPISDQPGVPLHHDAEQWPGCFHHAIWKKLDEHGTTCYWAAQPSSMFYHFLCFSYECFMMSSLWSDDEKRPVEIMYCQQREWRFLWVSECNVACVCVCVCVGLCVWGGVCVAGRC